MPSATEQNWPDWATLIAERQAVEREHRAGLHAFVEPIARPPTWIVSDIDTAAGRISRRTLQERMRSWSNTILAPYNSFPLGRLGGSWEDWHKLWGLVGQAHEARVFCKEVTYKDGKLTISDYPEAG